MNNLLATLRDLQRLLDNHNRTRASNSQGLSTQVGNYILRILLRMFGVVFQLKIKKKLFLWNRDKESDFFISNRCYLIY